MNERPHPVRGAARVISGVGMALGILAGPLLASPSVPTTPASPVRTVDQRRSLAVVESLWVAGRLDSCWARLAADLGEARARRDSLLVLDLVAFRGEARARSGLIKEAEPDLRAAIRLAGRAADDSARRRCWRWLAYTLGRAGKDSEARAAWNRLLSLSREGGDRVHEGWAWSGLAFLDWQSEDARAAAPGFARALALFRDARDARGEAFVLNGLGTVEQALGDYPRAEEHYLASAAAARACGWPWLEAVAFNNVASLRFDLGDPGQARKLYEDAAELHRRAGDRAEAAATGENIARCDAALGQFDAAAAGLDSLREDCRRHGLAHLESSLGNSLAEIRFEQGRFHAAAGLFRQTLCDSTNLPAMDRRDAVLGLARTLTELDSLGQALTLLNREAGRIREGDPEGLVEYEVLLGRSLLRAARWREARSMLAAAASAAERLDQRASRLEALCGSARAARELGRPDSALALYRAALRVWEMERGLPADPEWREVRGTAAAGAVAGLGGLLGDYPPGLPTEERARRAFDAVQIWKARTLLERMLGPAGQDSPALAPAPVTCTDLQQSILHPGELLLDFYLGEESGVGFAVSRDECRAFPIPGRRELEAVLAPYLDLVSSPGSAGSDGGGSPGRGGESNGLDEVHRRMRAILLEPVHDLTVRTRSLIVVPDGILDRLSFAALLAGGDPATPVAVPVLQTVPSASILAQLRHLQGRGSAGSGNVLALAGREDGRGLSLREAGREVRDLAARFHGVKTVLPAAMPADSLRGDEAGRDALLADMASFQILHFAAHATVEEEHPWRSSILLDVGNSSGPPVSLTAAAIARSRLRCRLVVLSTCRSAGGRVLSGEGVQGPAAAFLVAGVPAVVATLWPVDDADSRRLMRRFYHELAAGATVAEALSCGQEMLRQGPGGERPSGWAGFVVVGDGDVRVHLTEKSLPERFALPALLLLLGIPALAGRPVLRCLRSLFAVIRARHIRSGNDRGH